MCVILIRIHDQIDSLNTKTSTSKAAAQRQKLRHLTRTKKSPLLSHQLHFIYHSNNLRKRLRTQFFSSFFSSRNILAFVLGGLNKLSRRRQKVRGNEEEINSREATHALPQIWTKTYDFAGVESSFFRQGEGHKKSAKLPLLNQKCRPWLSSLWQPWLFRHL